MVTTTKSALFGILISIWATPGIASGNIGSQVFSPAEAIELAKKERLGVLGTYQFQVKGANVVNGVLFLNSEDNYRDPKNLTVRCDETATRMLTLRFSGSPAMFLKGKCIQAVGRPIRVPVALVVDGEVSNRGYYQTHIRISNPEMLTMCGQ